MLQVPYQSMQIPFTILLFLVILLSGRSGAGAQPPQRFDVLITELLPDPAPVVGLPELEFIELKNNSDRTIDLEGWQLSDGSTTAVIRQSFLLKRDSFLILCPSSGVAQYRPFGQTLGLSNFPSLNNEGDLVSLRSPAGQTIHAVAYSAGWFRNGVQAAGGWTLEMIDPANPCQGSRNWAACTDPAGGTPGRKNSVAAANPDNMPPALLRTYALSPATVVAVFDEPLDSLNAANPAHYTVMEEKDAAASNPVRAAVPLPPLFNEVRLQLTNRMDSAMVHKVIVRQVRDCAGNEVGALHQARSGWPVQPDSPGIVINEILFNPAPGGDDYIELYHGGDKVVDLQQLYLANRSATGALTSISAVSDQPWLFFPGEYKVLTVNPGWLQSAYWVKDPAALLPVASLPSLPDDKGTLVLTGAGGRVLDELPYDHHWHFALVDKEEGIALERIDHRLPAGDAHNWSSAASTAGFGTPGYRNSQAGRAGDATGMVTLSPKVFSPDQDGQDDYLFISYQLPAPGWMANITVFDIPGHPVRYLVKNALLGTKGSFRWDGLDEQSRKLPMGTYIVLTELYNLQGSVKKFRQVVVIAGRL